MRILRNRSSEITHVFGREIQKRPITNWYTYLPYIPLSLEPIPTRAGLGQELNWSMHLLRSRCCWCGRARVHALAPRCC
jgi:hypothetical protein